MSAKTFTVRQLGSTAWAGPGLTRKQAKAEAERASQVGLRMVATVCDETGEMLFNRAGNGVAK